MLCEFQERGIEIQNFNVIYELYDTVVAALESDLDQEEELTEQGIAEVKAVFNGRDGKVAGSEILEGTLLGGTADGTTNSRILSLAFLFWDKKSHLSEVYRWPANSLHSQGQEDG